MNRSRIRRRRRGMWQVEVPNDHTLHLYSTWPAAMRHVDERHWRLMKIEALREEVRIGQKSLHEHCPPDTAWFAWYPVQRNGDLVWLMWVARHRCHSFLGRWHYMPVHHAPEVKR